MSDRVLLVGENNPYGPDPEFALYPWPRSSAGYRLCKLVLEMDASDYLESFDRVNLLSEPKWSLRLARVAAAKILAERRRVVACGVKVAAAFGVPTDPFEVHELGECRVAVIPHPSGLCRAWGRPGAFERARELVRGLASPSPSPCLVVDEGDRECDAERGR